MIASFLRPLITIDSYSSSSSLSIDEDPNLYNLLKFDFFYGLSFSFTYSMTKIMATTTMTTNQVI